MPKEFYTERDIEDMVKRGVMSLELSDNVVLTDLAYEKANRLGMQLVHQKPANPPAAPMRPYIAGQQNWGAGRSSAPPASSPVSPPAPVTTYTPPARPVSLNGGPGAPVPAPQADGADLHKRIRNAVIARLGTQVDGNLLDVIITRVLKSTGVK